MIDYDLAARPWVLESPEGDPEGILPRGADDNGGPSRQREYKWTDHDGRQDGRARVEIVEGAETLSMREIDADFFQRLADGSGEKVKIRWLATPAGKCDLSRPSVADTDRAVDEEG